jgi:hypothetical protein
MDLGTLLAILAFLVAVLATIALGLRFLVPQLIGNLKGSFGSATGWATLSRVYATSSKPEGEVLKRQSLVAGAVVYRYLVTAVIGDTGLYLAVGGPLPRQPILIPWEDFKDVQSVRLFWQKAALVSIGTPRVGTLTLPMTLYDRIRPHLPRQLASKDVSSKPV